MKVAITGHRPKRLSVPEESIYQWVTEKLKELKCTEAISGMALGTDIIFAKAAMDLGVPLKCYFPYKKKRYSKDEKLISDYADDIKYFSESYGNRCYFDRDRALVDDCDVLLAVFDNNGFWGGTAYTVQYALDNNRTIIFYPFYENIEQDVRNGIPHTDSHNDVAWTNMVIDLGESYVF